MSIADSLGLQIPLATEEVVSVNLVDALGDFGGSDIGHEAIGAETVA